MIKKQKPRKRSKFFCADRMFDAMGQFGKKDRKAPPKKKKKRGHTKRSKKKVKKTPTSTKPKVSMLLSQPSPNNL